MKTFWMLLVALVVCVLAVTVLGVIGPFVAALGLVAAAVVVLNPGGIGAKLRQSIAWWSVPGMRKASSRAVPFAGLLLLYTVPVPMGAYALTHASQAPPASSAPQAGVGGGAASATPTVAQPTETAAPTATPVPTAVSTPLPTAAPLPPTPKPTAAPTAPPAPNLCGAPPNPWNYNFCGGGTIPSPPSNFCDYFTSCIPSFWQSTLGYVEECQDGDYSHSGGRSGSCSSHHGNLRPLNP